MIGRAARGVGLLRERGDYRPRDTRTVQGQWYEPSSLVVGERVTVSSAMSVPTVYACIRLLADTVGTTPLMVYREAREGDRSRSRQSPAWRVLHEEPNPAMSPTDLWSLVTTWVVGWGDAFLGKQFARNGELMALWPIHPRDVIVRIEGGAKVFEVSTDRGRETFTSEDVVQVMGASFDGLRGVSPIALARRELGMAMAAQRYAQAVWENTGVPRGALVTERELSDDAAAQLRADWQRVYGGPANAGRVAVLEEGMTFEPISMPMRDVQFVEQQQLSAQTLARVFRVPLSLIQADSPKGLTYSTAETENLQFLTHSVRPWYVRIEQALNRDVDLFPSSPVEFCEFLPAALLRVATKDRFEAYKIAAAGKPWMLIDEVRRAENMSALTPAEKEELEPPEPEPAAEPAAAASES